MVDGTYLVMLKTPMGAKKSELTLRDEGGVFTGSMNVMGKENPLSPGTADGEAFHFSGEIKTAVGKLAYECTGSVDGDSLTGTAKTKKGDLALTGTRK